MANIFNINGIQSTVPIGSVLAYIGSSTQDPNGWVIANGVSRDYSNIYDNLVSLSIGSRIGQYYAPPNLNAAFLRGTGNTTYNSIPYAGNAVLTQQSHAIKEHGHGASQAVHTHTTTPATTGGSGTAASPSYGIAQCIAPGGDDRTEENQGNSDDFYPNISYYGGLVVKDSTPAITVQENTGTNTDASETRPFSYGVVWIIKL